MLLMCDDEKCSQYWLVWNFLYILWNFLSLLPLFKVAQRKESANLVYISFRLMTETDIAEFQLPESSESHAGDTKLALHPSLPFLLLLFSILCITSAEWCQFPQN